MSLVTDSVPGETVDKLVVRPLHWLVRATGVVLLSAVTLGRFQVQPLAAEDWIAKAGRPALYSAPATAVGIAAWTVAALALFRHSGL